MLGMLALAGCPGNPVEAVLSPGSDETSAPTRDPDATTELPSGDSGGTMLPTDTTSTSTTSFEESSTDPSNETTGVAAACGDGSADPGEWCWFGPQVIAGVGGVAALAVASLDDDADLEIVLVDAVAAPLLIEHGGAGWTVLAISALPYGVNSLVAGDLDGDGFDDIVGTNAAYALYTAFGGATGLRTGQTFSTYGNSGIVALFDGDLDGDLDVAYAWAASSEVDFYANDLGTIGYWTYAYGTGTSHVDLAVADTNNDGFRDVIAMGMPGALDVYRASAATTLVVDGSDVSDGASTIAVGDLDGDGWVDVARLIAGGDSLALFRGKVDGWQRPVVLPVAVDLVDLDTADLDGDGDLDLALAGGTELVMFENLGKADFEARDAVELALPAQRIAVADLDDNGRVEVILHGPLGLEIALANP